MEELSDGVIIPVERVSKTRKGVYVSGRLVRSPEASYGTPVKVEVRKGGKVLTPSKEILTSSQNFTSIKVA